MKGKSGFQVISVLAESSGETGTEEPASCSIQQFSVGKVHQPWLRHLKQCLALYQSPSAPFVLEEEKSAEKINLSKSRRLKGYPDGASVCFDLKGTQRKAVSDLDMKYLQTSTAGCKNNQNVMWLEICAAASVANDCSPRVTPVLSIYVKSDIRAHQRVCW